MEVNVLPTPALTSASLICSVSLTCFTCPGCLVEIYAILQNLLYPVRDQCWERKEIPVWF